MPLSLNYSILCSTIRKHDSWVHHFCNYHIYSWVEHLNLHLFERLQISTFKIRQNRKRLTINKSQKRINRFDSKWKLKSVKLHLKGLAAFFLSLRAAAGLFLFSQQNVFRDWQDETRIWVHPKVVAVKSCCFQVLCSQTHKIPPSKAAVYKDIMKTGSTNNLTLLTHTTLSLCSRWRCCSLPPNHQYQTASSSSRSLSSWSLSCRCYSSLEP